MAITSAPKRRALALRPTGRRLAQVARELATPRTLLVGGALVIVGYLAVVPLVYLLHDTFTGPAGLSIGAFTRAYSASSQAGRMMLNSLEFAVGSGALALAIGTLLAYVQVRTDAPLKSLFFAASLVPLIIPGILYAAAWIFLADPRIGLINVVLFEPILGHGLFNTFSMWGMIWVQGLHLAPIAFLLMGAAFRSMDPSLEEAALMAGAPRHLLLRRITMPLVRPAIVSAILLMFVQSLESFEVPGLLGLQNGIYVFTSRIYFVLRQFPIDYGAAGAYALGLLAFAVAGVAASGWLSSNARSYQTVTGKAFRPRPMELGRARPLVGALVVLFFAVAVVLPVAVLVYASLLRFYSAPSLDSLRTMSLANYRSVLHTPLAITALRNSVVLGVGAATVVMFLTAVLLGGRAHQGHGQAAARRGRLHPAGGAGPGARPGVVVRVPADRAADLRDPVDPADRLRDALPALRHALRQRGDVADLRRAGGVGARLRRVLVADLPARAAAAGLQRHPRRLGLHPGGLLPGAVLQHPAVQPGQRGPVHPDLGAVRERAVHHAGRHRRVHGGHPGAAGPGRLPPGCALRRR